MSAKKIDGIALAQSIRNEIACKAEAFKNQYGRPIGLAVLLVGDDPASHVYVNNKEKACMQTGIKSFIYRLPQTATQQEVEAIIHDLNADESVDGLLVQVPLPKHLDEKRVLSIIDPDKDVDGFGAINVGKLFLSQDCCKACTPSGIIELIRSTEQPISGKHAVVIGRSNTVGKPVALLLLEENATVTICHSRTQNLSQFTKSADILICAVGKKDLVTADMVKPGAIVIDVGMNRVDGKLYGDVDFESVNEVAGYLTPVPGGVGPMTVTMLLANTVKAAYRGK